MKNRAWMVRCGEGSYLFEDFTEKSVVAFGSNDIGSIREITALEEIKALVLKQYPERKKGAVIATASQIYKFAHEIAVGDYVVTYDRITRMYSVGRAFSRTSFVFISF